jgi:hypothetical protein
MDVIFQTETILIKNKTWSLQLKLLLLFIQQMWLIQNDNRLTVPFP